MRARDSGRTMGHCPRGSYPPGTDMRNDSNVGFKPSIPTQAELLNYPIECGKPLVVVRDPWDSTPVVPAPTRGWLPSLAERLFLWLRSLGQ